MSDYDINHFQEGDIYRWSWNDEMLKRLDYKNNAGTLYWCCSRIGVVRDGILYDTYWMQGSNHSKSFSRDGCQEKLVIQFVANVSELVAANPTDRAFYSDDDCVDLNHPNSTTGNFYIRKHAIKDTEKINRILKRRKKFLSKKIESINWDISRIDEALLSVGNETYFHVENDVSIDDHSYQDE